MAPVAARATSSRADDHRRSAPSPPASRHGGRRMSDRTKVAIIGSGNIGTDLMIKVLRLSRAPRDGRDGRHRPRLRRPGPRRAARVPTTADGVDGLIAMPGFDEIDDRLRRHLGQGAPSPTPRSSRRYGKRLVDLTPAAIGPFVVPAVNLDEHLDAPNVNMVTCGGQATIPIVAAVSRVDAGALRRDRRLDRLEVGRPRHPRQHRRVHRDHRRTRSSRSAAPGAARRSSSSTRPSRR